MQQEKYDVIEIPGAHRFWFSREFLDEKHGRERAVHISLEKAGWQVPDLVSSLPWNLSIEDRNIRQTWKLTLMKMNGDEKLVFERYIKTKEGVKVEVFDLAYLPIWIVEEIRAVERDLGNKTFDGGMNFLNNLSKKIEKEKKIARGTATAKIEELSIGGLYHIMSQTRKDERGSFREVARMGEIELLTGYDFVGKQMNHSVSTYGVLRGIHVEPWAKLVTVTDGFVVSVLLDCRPKSKTFGKMETVYLGYGKTPEGVEVSGGALFIEPGIGNSLLTLSEKADYNYIVDDLWRPETALYAVNTNDPQLKIDWSRWVPMDKQIRSDRDKGAMSFDDFVKLLEKK